MIYEQRECHDFYITDYKINSIKAARQVSNYWTAKCSIVGHCIRYFPQKVSIRPYFIFLPSKRLIIGQSLAEKHKNRYLYPESLENY